MSRKKNELTVGICTPPLIASAGVTILSRLIDVISPSICDIYLLTGKAACDSFKDDKRIKRCEFQAREAFPPGNNLLATALRLIYTQITAAYKVFMAGMNVDSWIFFLGADQLLLAVLVAKILRRDVMISMSGDFLHPSVAAAARFPKINSVLFNTSRLFSDRIVLYSDLIKELNLEPYREKIIIAQRHFLNFDQFSFKNDLKQRDSLIGYMGRLTFEKGILNLVEAIPKALAKRRDLKFLIAGAGELEGVVRTSLRENVLCDKVEVSAWIPQEEIPNCLATLRLLVIPSYTEGLPNIMLEAMACGTPVLATPVGAIPDVIKDKETGFLLRDNSPACVAEGIVQALDYPHLEQLATNARNLVENRFRYEDAVKSWARVLRTRDA